MSNSSIRKIKEAAFKQQLYHKDIQQLIEFFNSSFLKDIVASVL
jgi:hypothetical protein